MTKIWMMIFTLFASFHASASDSACPKTYYDQSLKSAEIGHANSYATLRCTYEGSICKKLCVDDEKVESYSKVADGWCVRKSKIPKTELNGRIANQIELLIKYTND